MSGVASSMSLQQIAAIMGGKVRHDKKGPYVAAPGPGHSPKDFSLSIRLEPSAPRGILVNTFSPKDDGVAAKDYVCDKLGLAPFKPRNGHKVMGGVVFFIESRTHSGGQCAEEGSTGRARDERRERADRDLFLYRRSRRAALRSAAL